MNCLQARPCGDWWRRVSLAGVCHEQSGSVGRSWKGLGFSLDPRSGGRLQPLLVGLFVALMAFVPSAAKAADIFRVMVTKGEAYAFGCMLSSKGQKPLSGWAPATGFPADSLDRQCRAVAAARAGGACQHVPEATIQLCSMSQEQGQPVLRQLVKVRVPEVLSPAILQNSSALVRVRRFDSKTRFQQFLSKNSLSESAATASGKVSQFRLIDILVKPPSGTALKACAMPALQPAAAMRYLERYPTPDKSAFVCSAVFVNGGRKLLTAAHCVNGMDLYLGDAKLICSTPQDPIPVDCPELNNDSKIKKDNSGWDIAVCEVPGANGSGPAETLISGEPVAKDAKILIAGFGKSNQGQPLNEDTVGEFCAGTAVLEKPFSCLPYTDLPAQALAKEDDQHAGALRIGDSGGAVFLPAAGQSSRKLLGILIEGNSDDRSHFLDLRSPHLSKFLSCNKIVVPAAKCP